MPSTIYRFTPPTCTLEIIGRRSSLSRWTTNDVLKKIRFKLRFDDPRQATSRQVTIQGSQEELLQLQTALDNYVQNQLQSSFELANFHPVTQPSAKVDRLPYLQPQGLMHHELFFGSLTHDSDRQQLKLGTVQLFDLVTAFEEYQTKIAILSDIKAKSQQKVIPLWGKIAVVAIVTASIGTVISLFKPEPQPNIISDRSQSESSPVIPELSEITPPATPDGDSQTATPKLGEPIASARRLPPPPAVETPKPKPNIPDPADYPLSQVARQSGLNDSANDLARQKKSPPSTEAETQIEVSPEIITSPSDRETKADTELNVQTDTDTVPSTEDLTTNPSIQPNQKLLNPKKTELALSVSQTREVAAYFRKNWQPPENLKQSLEYRLFIAPNGSIQQIIPLGKAARMYLSKTKIPVNGESFISPISTDRTATIRLLLNPDGKVQAFEE